jgi:uncharacterized protein YcbK (DUF882 family)
MAGIVTLLLTALTPSLTETAIANGDTRTINLYHSHTQESISATYLVHGQYDQAVLQQLNWFLRDWRRDEPTTMDPRLFDVVWETYRNAGAGTEVVKVVSAYRSPETNAMLRSRSRAVAKYSQHMLGKAMDTTMPGMPMARIREIGMRMQRGGVGYYPSAGTPFVHLDVGSVRSWPRMGYDQLARLFPDGKTVHLPANGQPLPRYEEARAEIEARGNGAYVTARRSGAGGFLAFLFGGGEEDEDASLAAPAPSTRKQWASLAPRNSRGAGMAAAETDEEGGAAAPPEKPGRRGRTEEIARAEANLPRGETSLSVAPAAEQEPQKPEKAEKLAFARAPLPPERPASLDKPTSLDVPPTPPERPAALASLEPADGARGLRGAVTDPNIEMASRADDDVNAAVLVNAPLPPRRPANLAASNLAASLSAAPLPPARPIAIAAARSPSAPAGGKANEADAANALANLIDATGTTRRPGDKPLTALNAAAKLAAAPPAAVTTAAQGEQRPRAPTEDAAAQALMAYAPAPRGAEEPEPRAEAAPKPAASRTASAQTMELVPDRPDRANVRANVRASTGASPAGGTSGASVLGSSIGGLRSAARAAALPGAGATPNPAPRAAEPPSAGKGK